MSYVGERRVDAQAVAAALQLPSSILLQEVCYDDLSTSFLLRLLCADGRAFLHTTDRDVQGVEDLALPVL